MPSFEEQLTALESVVEQLEKGDLSLEDSVRLFEEGVRLSKSCKGELDAAEGRIEVLMENATGRKQAVPLEVETDPADEG